MLIRINFHLQIISLHLDLSFSRCYPRYPDAKKPVRRRGNKTVPKVTTTAVIQQETTDYDEYTGKTEASETVDIHARVFGYLKSIEFKDGDFVKEGQTLFTIEPDEYQAIHNQSLSKIAVWESKLEVAKADLARRKATMAASRGRGQPGRIRAVCCGCPGSRSQSDLRRKPMQTEPRSI